MLTCKDIPMRPNSLHRAKRITSICVICINFHIELTAASFFFFIYFHNTVLFIKTGRFWKLNPLLGAGDQLKTCVIRAGKKQKTVTLKKAWNLLIFHVHNKDCIIHWLDFWKRWVAETESFFILGFTYEYKLINISPLFSFADTKRGNVTTISKD